MSLATRCSHCSTIFRVVQDQLKVSEGWVRCGRCGQVFNALEGLFDLDSGGTPSGPGVLRGPETGLPPQTIAPPVEERPVEPPPPAPPPVPVSEYDTQADTQADSRHAASSSSQFDFDGIAVSRPSSNFDDEDHEPRLRDPVLGAAAIAVSDDDDDAAPPAPGFVRTAERAAVWDTPRVRARFVAVAFVLALLLVGQWAVLRRDAIVARWPEALPLLSTLCAPFSCKVEHLRRLEALAVESSGLTRIEGTPLYRLQVVLRNRDAVAVMTPSLDLALTDARNDTVARRVLQPRDMAPNTPLRLAPGTELQLAALLDLGERRVAGYTVELFYP